MSDLPAPISPSRSGEILAPGERYVIVKPPRTPLYGRCDLCGDPLGTGAKLVATGSSIRKVRGMTFYDHDRQYRVCRRHDQLELESEIRQLEAVTKPS